MNIFATSSCPVESAQALDDKRLVKMVLESAQLISTALSRLGYWHSNLYRPTHVSHPCARWAARSRGNFDWLVRHGLALAEEYRYRYGREHQSSFVIQACAKAFKKCPLDELGLTPFENCTNITGNIPVTSRYRQYLIQEKWRNSDPRWTRRGPPVWYTRAAR